MTFSPAQAYFDTDGKPTDKFLSLATTNQTIITRLFRLHLKDFGFFFTEAGPNEQFVLLDATERAEIFALWLAAHAVKKEESQPVNLPVGPASLPTEYRPANLPARPADLPVEISASLADKYRYDTYRRDASTALAAVPVFNRERDVASINHFDRAMTIALDKGYSSHIESDRITYLKSRLSPTANQWLDTQISISLDIWQHIGTSEAVTAKEILALLLKEHWPLSDEDDARRDLKALKLTAFSSFNLFTEAFSYLVPRLGDIDRRTLVDHFKAAIGKEFALQISMQLLNNPSPSSNEYIAYGRKMWDAGYRQTPSGQHTPRPSNPKATDDKNGRDPAKDRLPSPYAADFKQKALSSAVQLQHLRFNRLWTAKEKELYLLKKCFNCQQPGHLSSNCPSKTTPPASPDRAAEKPKSPTVALDKVDLGNLRFVSPSKPIATSQTTTIESEGENPILPNKLFTGFNLPLVPSHIRMYAEPIPQTSNILQKIQLQQMEGKGLDRGLIESYLDRKAGGFATRKRNYLATIGKSHPPISLSSASTEEDRVIPGSLIGVTSPDQSRLNFRGTANGIARTFLADTGAQGMFMSNETATTLGLTQLPLPGTTVQVQASVGSAKGHISTYVTCRCEIGSYWKDLNFLIADIGDTIILGVPWFNSIKLQLSWNRKHLQFQDKFTGRHHKWSQSSGDTTESPCSLASAKLLPHVSVDEYQRQHRSYVYAARIHLSSILEDWGDSKNETDEFKERMANLFPDVFGDMTGLPPSREEDMAIDLDPTKAKPKQRGSPKLTERELLVLKERITELLDRGFIRPSTSDFAASILFAKKADGSLRLCVDYRGLNDSTFKVRSPLPNVTEMRNQLRHAKFFTKLDLRDGYHNIRIKSNDISKTAFKCRYGHYEYTVVPFGLSNAPAIFSNMMNRVLSSVLDVCAISFMDDILIYSETEEDHHTHIRQVLKLIEKEKLHLKLSKCEFFKKEVTFCGHVVGVNGMQIGAERIKAMTIRPHIRGTLDIQKYLGSLVWFHEFIPDYSALTEPLSKLLRTGAVWEWGDEQEEAITLLIYLINSAPVLKFFDPALETVVFSDASEHAIGGWIGQIHPDGTHPICYWSRKLTSAERAYHIYDKELLALISLVEREGHLLRGIPFTANTDHRALEHLQSQPVLKGRQVRWMLTLQEYDIKIVYHPGGLNTVADFLTRNPAMESYCTKCRGPINLDAVSIRSKSFKDLVKEAYSNDVLAQRLIQLQQEPLHRQSRLLAQFKCIDGLWYYCDTDADTKNATFRCRLYVPDSAPLRTELLLNYHDAPSAGHPAAVRTLRKLERLYFWPGMRRDVQAYTQSCEVCQRHNESTQSKYGFLHPLPIPEDRGTALSIDWFFMPRTEEGFDAVMVIICRLTKLLVLIPCRKTDSAEQSARQFVDHWFSRGMGLPEAITSDRDSKFSSKFWTAVCLQLGIKQNMTTSRHQQANGQAEIQVRIVKKLVRKFAESETDWFALLPVLEFALNNSTHSSTGYTPFYLFFGFHPRCFPEEVPTGKSASNSLLHQIGTALSTAKSAIQESQERMATEYNKHRRASPVFQTGDSVFVSSEGLTLPATASNHKSLLPPWIGPVSVARGNEPLPDQAGSELNVTVELPPGMTVHPTFHVEKVKPFIASNPGKFPNRPQDVRSSPTFADGEQYCDVERILDHKKIRKRLFYLVKYVGAPVEEAEWHEYNESDPTWDEDRHFVHSYCARKNLPVLPASEPVRRSDRQTTRNGTTADPRSSLKCGVVTSVARG
jgi:hypothetical protein